VIVARGLVPQPLPVHQLCHKGMASADDAIESRHGLPDSADRLFKTVRSPRPAPARARSTPHAVRAFAGVPPAAAD